MGLILPLAYDFQPDMVLMALGPAHGLQTAQAALLAAMLRGPVGGRILAVVEEVNWAGGISCVGGRWTEKPCLTGSHPRLSLDQESILQLARTLAQTLNGEAPPSLGPFLMAAPEEIQALMFLKAQLEPRWKLLQVAGEAPGEAQPYFRAKKSQVHRASQLCFSSSSTRIVLSSRLKSVKVGNSCLEKSTFRFQRAVA